MLVDHSLSETAQNASSVPRLPRPRVPPGFFRCSMGITEIDHRDRKLLNTTVNMGLSRTEILLQAS